MLVCVAGPYELYRVKIMDVAVVMSPIGMVGVFVACSLHFGHRHHGFMEPEVPMFG